MSEFRGRIYDSEVASRRAEAKGDWLLAVERAADRLSDAELEHCLNQRNLDAWWPGTSERQQEVA